MFNRVYGYMLRNPATERGYWGRWYYRDRYEKVLARLSEYCCDKRTTILDLGCGSGIYAQYLRKAGCECYYVGCDIESKSLKLAHRDDSVDYILCDIRQLPFRKRCAQVVLCSEVLEHLPTPYQTLKKACELPIEMLLITFPEERPLHALKDRHPEHISFIDKQIIANLLFSSNLKVIYMSQIFSSFIPCGVLEFLHVPRNNLTQVAVCLVDRIMRRLVPSMLVPHRTILIDARQTL